MLILFCISVVIGAVGYHVLGFSFGEVVVLGALWGALFVLLFRSKKSVVLALALTGSVLVGALRFSVVDTLEVPLGNQALTGVVARVDTRLEKTSLIVIPSGTTVRIQVSTFEQQRVLPGDTISFRGVVALPEDFSTETGRVFDYDGYLESRGVDAVMYRAQVVPLTEKNREYRWEVVRIATQVRLWIAAMLAQRIGFPIDGIVGGMLVGFQGGIPSFISDLFRQTGTLHTLVLSGYNITVLAGFLGFLFRRFPFRAKTILIFFGVIVLVVVSGSGVAAVRAGIMGSIALFAGATLNTYHTLRALLVAFLFFFFFHPLTVFVDPGFHLSFLATLFIIMFLPLLKGVFHWIPQKLQLQETLLLAVGLPLFTLPYTMYFSGMFPLITPLANIVMVPIIPILMFGGLLTVVLFWFSPLANLIGDIVSLFGNGVVELLTLFSKAPSWNTPVISGWGVSVFYIFVVVVCFRKDILTFLLHLRTVFQR